MTSYIYGYFYENERHYIVVEEKKNNNINYFTIILYISKSKKSVPWFNYDTLIEGQYGNLDVVNISDKSFPFTLYFNENDTESKILSKITHIPINNIDMCIEDIYSKAQTSGNYECDVFRYIYDNNSYNFPFGSIYVNMNLFYDKNKIIKNNKIEFVKKVLRYILCISMIIAIIVIMSYKLKIEN
jgi:hypothetical protein